MWEAYHRMVIKQLVTHMNRQEGLVSFPDLPRLQFLIACSMVHFGIHIRMWLISHVV